MSQAVSVSTLISRVQNLAALLTHLCRTSLVPHLRATKHENPCGARAGDRVDGGVNLIRGESSSFNGVMSESSTGLQPGG